AEITVGENGWHPHLHALFFIDRILTEDEMKTLEQFFWERWANYIEAAGYGLVSREHGVRVSHGESAGNYVALLSKQNLALEIGSSGTKQGRKGSRSIMQLWYDWMVHRRDSDKKLIKEYQRATRRMNQLTWSRGKNDLRKKYQVAEQLDFDLVQDPTENTGQLIARMHSSEWLHLLRRKKSWLWELPKITEKLSPTDAQALIDSLCNGSGKTREKSLQKSLCRAYEIDQLGPLPQAAPKSLTKAVKFARPGTPSTVAPKSLYGFLNRAYKLAWTGLPLNPDWTGPPPRAATK
ncbi:unnamed protein product, partial [marine sediment metagenome]